MVCKYNTWIIDLFHYYWKNLKPVTDHHHFINLCTQTLASQPNHQWLIEPLKLCWTSLGTVYVYLMLTQRWMIDFSPLSLRNGSMEWFMFHLMGLCGKVMLYYQRRLAFPRRPWLLKAAHSTCVIPTMWNLIIWLFFISGACKAELCCIFTGSIPVVSCIFTFCCTPNNNKRHFLFKLLSSFLIQTKYKVYSAEICALMTQLRVWAWFFAAPMLNKVVTGKRYNLITIA